MNGKQPKGKKDEVKLTEGSQDKEGPIIKIAAKQSFSESSYVLKGSVKDKGSKKIYIEVDGNSIPVKKNGKFSIPRYSPTNEEVEIVAIDQWGNKTSKIVSVKIKIKEDSIGKFLQDDMVREGLKFPLGFTSPDVSTGCCTIFVEQDGTRTMCTYLGAGTLIGPEDIIEEDIKNHQITYLEGYLWDNEKAKQAMKKMVDIFVFLPTRRRG